MALVGLVAELAAAITTYISPFPIFLRVRAVLRLMAELKTPEAECVGEAVLNLRSWSLGIEGVLEGTFLDHLDVKVPAVYRSALAELHELRTQRATDVSERTDFAAWAETHLVVKTLLRLSHLVTELAVFDRAEPFKTLFTTLRKAVGHNLVQEVAAASPRTLVFEKELADSLAVRTAVFQRTAAAFGTAAF